MGIYNRGDDHMAVITRQPSAAHGATHLDAPGEPQRDGAAGCAKLARLENGLG